jgi:hypothetical protein
MKTLDLFSGVGGITYALRGITDTVCFCEIDPFARAVLHNNMRLNKLPKAEVSRDVKQLDGKQYRKDVRMIVGGFPCVGMSSLGLREGFGNEQTGLFKEIMRLTDEIKPDYLFLENVPGVLNLGMKHVVRELHLKRGYEVSWCIVGAWQVGAPHSRDRWFLLAKKPGLTTKLKLKPYKRYPWGKGEPCERLVDKCKKEHVLRCAAMGNSVCPDAVRQAFMLLASGCKDKRISSAHVTLKDLAAPEGNLPLRNPCTCKGVEFPRNGCILAPRKKGEWGELYALPDILPRTRKDLKLVIVPPKVTRQQLKNPMLSSTVLRKPVKLAQWSTPRYGNTGHSVVLTERTIRDLPSQLRYERKTPVRSRSGHTNAQFLEYMMGYPQDWTKPW